MMLFGVYPEGFVSSQFELVHTGSGCNEGGPHQLREMHHQIVS